MEDDSARTFNGLLAVTGSAPAQLSSVLKGKSASESQRTVDDHGSAPLAQMNAICEMWSNGEALAQRPSRLAERRFTLYRYATKKCGTSSYF